MQNKKRISLNNLPEYTEWPKKLLDIDMEGTVSKKTHSEVIREYNTDKWGKLLNDISTCNNISVSDVDKIVNQEADRAIPYWNGSEFILDSEEGVIEHHIEIYSSILKKYIENSTGLCELGAGYGRFILKFAKAKLFSDLNFYAGELTETGQELIKIIARSMGISINTGFCDFRSQTLKNINIKPGAVIYTSYAVCYIPILQDDFPDFLLSMKPSMVVHFEPCFEHHKTDLYGLMCRKYIKMNDYNTNLLTILKKAEKAGRIEIIEEKKNVIGSNPLLPVSVLAWRAC